MSCVGQLAPTISWAFQAFGSFKAVVHWPFAELAKCFTTAWWARPVLFSLSPPSEHIMPFAGSLLIENCCAPGRTREAVLGRQDRCLWRQPGTVYCASSAAADCVRRTLASPQIKAAVVWTPRESFHWPERKPANNCCEGHEGGKALARWFQRSRMALVMTVCMRSMQGGGHLRGDHVASFDSCPAASMACWCVSRTGLGQLGV